MLYRGISCALILLFEHYSRGTRDDGFSGQLFVCVFFYIICFVVATCVCDLVHDVK